MAIQTRPVSSIQPMRYTPYQWKGARLTFGSSKTDFPNKPWYIREKVAQQVTQEFKPNKNLYDYNPKVEGKNYSVAQKALLSFVKFYQWMTRDFLLRTSNWVKQKLGKEDLIIKPRKPDEIVSVMGDCCLFYPNCSRYGTAAIKAKGAFKGGWAAFSRVFRCNHVTMVWKFLFGKPNDFCKVGDHWYIFDPVENHVPAAKKAATRAIEGLERVA